MAVLSKIRKRSGLLLLAIGFALLAFVVQDLFTKGFKSLSKDVGSINGKDVTFEEFRVKVANVEKNGQGTTATQAANQVWDQEVAIALLTKEFEDLGIRTGRNHIIEVLKSDPNIGQNPAFLNQLGKFDIKKFDAFFNSNPEQAKMLKDREKDADLSSKYQIYSTLLKGGMYTTTAEGKYKYEAETNKVDFDFVTVLYSSVKDSDVKVTDADITDYMKKHEKRFKSDGSREIEYVLVEDKPSAKDEEEVKNKVAALLDQKVEFRDGKSDTIPGFKSATNIAEFVANNSDKPYDTTYVTKQQLPAQFADALYNLPTGEIYGPYIDGKYYCLSKSMGKKANAKVKASHILISWEGTKLPNKKEKRTKEQAKAKADALLAQAQANPTSFMMLALTNSDDSSAQQGGDLGYFGPNQMVKPFNDFAFGNPVGKIGLIETEFGYHIVNITDKQDAVRLATVAQKIDPSEATTNEAYTKATKFEMDANGKDFAAVAKSAGLVVNAPVKAKPMDENFGNVGNQRQIVKWAYDKETEIGNVKRFEIPNVGHVIAKLKKVNEKGLMTVEEAKPMVEMTIKNELKAKKILAKMKGSSLDAIAKANATGVQIANGVSLENPLLPIVGAEPKVVGTAFGIGANKISAPVEGIAGVFVVKTRTITKAPKLAKYDDYVNRLKGNAAQAASRALPALKNDANIEDNRLEFY